MAIDPISLGVGVVSAGMGIGQSIAGNQAAKQSYAEQKALSDATSRFNSWQANQNARLTDLNNQYQYWAQKVQYNQDLAYVNQMRNYDLSMEIAQAKKVGDTCAAAGADYAINSQALARERTSPLELEHAGERQDQARLAGLEQIAAAAATSKTLADGDGV